MKYLTLAERKAGAKNFMPLDCHPPPYVSLPRLELLKEPNKMSLEQFYREVYK